MDMTGYLQGRISPMERYESLLEFPRYFEIETVNACNAKCPMCTIADWNRRDGLMEEGLFEKIANEIGEHPEVKRIHLYRDGEPLLDKRLAKKVAMLKERAVRRVGISTNVELLDSGKAEALLAAGLDEIILSIDSLQKDVYEKIRVGLDFNRVMRNALAFIQLRDRLRPSCQVWVRMIRQPDNTEEWTRYKRYWRSLVQPTDRVDFRLLHNWGSQLPGHNTVRHDPKPCVALWSLMVIFANGDVPMCNVDYNNKRPLGNVRQHTISYLWRSKTQNERRRLHMEGKKAELGLCKNCNVWS